MRFKKQIIYICLFTFLFLPFQVNRNEIDVKADVLTMSYLTYEIITALLLATGIVITGNDTHNALVQEFYDKSRAEAEEISRQVANGERVSVGKKVMDTVKEVYNLTYTDSVEHEYTTIKVNGIEVENFSPTFSCEYQYPFTITEPTEVIYGFNANQTVKATLNKVGEYYLWFRYVKGDNYPYKITVRNVANGTNHGSMAYRAVESLALYFSLGLSIPYTPDWSDYRDKNKDLNVSMPVGSVCVGSTLSDSLLKEMDNSKQYQYPLTSEQLGVDFVPDGVADGSIDKPDIGETETPTTGDGLWDTLFGWLKTLLSPITKLLSSLWDLIKGLFDMLKGLLTSILELIKSLVQALIDGIASLFVPTVSLEEIFKDTQKNFISQIVNFFDFSTLWNIEPKPLEFKVKMPFYDFAKGESVPYEFDIKFFENKFMKENINLIRNIITYPILITTVYFIILHFMPKRDID